MPPPLLLRALCNSSQFERQYVAFLRARFTTIIGTLGTSNASCNFQLDLAGSKLQCLAQYVANGMEP